MFWQETPGSRSFVPAEPGVLPTVLNCIRSGRIRPPPAAGSGKRRRFQRSTHSPVVLWPTRADPGGLTETDRVENGSSVRGNAGERLDINLFPGTIRC